MKLTELFDRRAALLAQFGELEDQLRRANGELNEGSSRASSEKDFARLSGAAVAAQLLPPRGRKLNAERAALDQELADAIQSEANRWNRWVAWKAEETFDRLMSVIEPFYGGPQNAALTRREHECVHIPLVAEIRRAGVDLTGSRGLPAENQIRLAQWLLSREADMCRKWGWPAPDDLPARPPAPKKPAPPEKVKVRARQTFACAALQLPNPNRKSSRDKPWRDVQKGEILEIAFHDYCALSRFFDRLDAPVSAAR